MPEVVTALIALGSNLGDREAHLAFARSAIASLPATTMVAASPVEETAPLGGMAQPPYLNQVLMVRTSLSPRALLDALHAMEFARGRERTERWGSRTLDCDVITYGDVRSDDPELRLPHPGLLERDFWQRGISAITHGAGAGDDA